MSDKLFTQEEVNELLAQRVSRENQKYEKLSEKYNEVSSKVEELSTGKIEADLLKAGINKEKLDVATKYFKGGDVEDFKKDMPELFNTPKVVSVEELIDTTKKDNEKKVELKQPQKITIT